MKNDLFILSFIPKSKECMAYRVWDAVKAIAINKIGKSAKLEKEKNPYLFKVCIWCFVLCTLQHFNLQVNDDSNRLSVCLYWESFFNLLKRLSLPNAEEFFKFQIINANAQFETFSSELHSTAESHLHYKL